MWGLVIALGSVASVGLICLTGAWRVLLRPACIDIRTMTADRLGFHISDPADTDRVDAICRAFAGGFNKMVAAASSTAWRSFADGQAVHYRPFAQEGAAMGYPLRALGRFSAARFEKDLVGRNPGYGYLYYVGLGFWQAMRRRPVGAIERLVSRLDPLHGMLCWDGYGFKFGFFDFRDGAGHSKWFENLRGYSGNVAYQGLGRSLWFRYLGEPETLVQTLRSLGVHAADAASGVGLASVFAMFDRLERSEALLRSLPEDWHADVLLGMCFGFKARSINDRAYFESVVGELDSERGAAIRQAIVRCDAVEEQVRRDDLPDGYRRWRETLRDWLGEHVAYPFASLLAPASAGLAAGARG